MFHSTANTIPFDIWQHEMCSFERTFGISWMRNTRVVLVVWVFQVRELVLSFWPLGPGLHFGTLMVEWQDRNRKDIGTWPDILLSWANMA